MSDELLFEIVVDLGDSPAMPEGLSVTLLMSPGGMSGDELRVVCAEHYKVPLEKVGPAVLTTQDAFDRRAEDELYERSDR